MDAATVASAGKRPKSRWTREKERRLIALYRDWRLLWDRTHPDYHKKCERERAMQAIAEGMGHEFDVADVKFRIKTLRDYYAKEVKKGGGSRPSASAYTSGWELYQCWEFLHSRVNVGTSSEPAAAMSYPRTAPRENNQGEISTGSSSQPYERDTSRATAACTSATSIGETGARTGPSTSAANASLLATRDHDDGEHLFSRLVAHELRHLSAYQRDLAKVRIQQVLVDVKYMSQAPAVGSSEELRRLQPSNVAVASQLGQEAASIPTVVSAPISREDPLFSKGPRHPAFERATHSV